MKIRKLEICGFKSFVDRTVVHFDHDVTGIVGPNGCGKSNIVDAIRWCMGEQSARHLRGKSMDDVIFNGSESRGPHSFAEVTITFDNAEGIGPAEYRDYAEIAVTRRLDRQGQSDYLINKTPVRLMDVTDLFLGTGVGTKAYSIIEQGRIGFIVSSRPEDRRYLIEEAAGITKFKAKKKAAERKIEQTRFNLQRVGDITAEIERSLATLERQAKKAARYKEYRAEIRDLELHSASHKWLELSAVMTVASHGHAEASAIAEGARLALRMREAELEVERLALAVVERRVEDAQGKAFAADNAVRQLEGELERLRDRLEALRSRDAAAEAEQAEVRAQETVLAGEQAEIAAALAGHEDDATREAATLAAAQEELDRRRTAQAECETAVRDQRTALADAETAVARADATLAGLARRREEGHGRLERLGRDRDEQAARVETLLAEADELRARLVGLSSGKEGTAARRGDVEVQLAALRAEIQDSDRLVEKLRGEHAEKRARLRSLEEVHHRFEGVGQGVRAVMQKFGGDASSGVLGLVADRIDVAAEHTHALAAALGDRLSDIVVRDLDAAEAALAFLEGQRGRAAFTPRTPKYGERSLSILPVGESAAGVVGWLADLVHTETADQALVRHLVEGVLVVTDLATARRLADEVAPATLVTLRGEVLAADGRLAGGHGDDAGAHMLDVKREMRELGLLVTKLDVSLGAAVERHKELRTGIATLQAELEAARNAAHDNEIALVKAERDLTRVDGERARTAERRDHLAQEAIDLAAALATESDEESAARDEIARGGAMRERATKTVLEAEAVLAERRASVDEQTREVTELRVRSAQATQQAQGERDTVARLERSLQDLVARRERLVAEIVDGARKQGELAAAIVAARETLRERAGEAMEAHRRLDSTRAHFDEERARLGEHEVALRDTRARIEREEKRSNELELRLAKLDMELSHLLEHVMERHRLDVRKVLGDYHARDLVNDAQRERLADLVRLVERMGEINLTAIEEHAEQQKRYAYYSGHKKDLDDALTQLELAIRKMNAESKRLFKETFAEVNARFKRVFPKMFGGGQAELRLTHPDDILESGVEIVAQPPGKKLGSIELMSGGEKALTAVSLVFSIFQYKPAPFCLLDEVDAPLDEANIGRFADAVRQMTDRSQFIVITHSKRTMETADVLYGVTMETPGVSKLVSVELRRRQAKQEAPLADVAVA